MPKLARIVIPGCEHHLASSAGGGVTGLVQRGNNKQDVFFVDDDRRLYLRILADLPVGRQVPHRDVTVASVRFEAGAIG